MNRPSGSAGGVVPIASPAAVELACHSLCLGALPLEVARSLGAAALACPLRDYPGHSVAGPGTPEQQVPGRGILDLPAFVRALLDAGYGGTFTLVLVGAVRRGVPHPAYPPDLMAELAREARETLSGGVL